MNRMSRKHISHRPRALYLRVPLESLLDYSRKLYDNEETAQKVAKKAAKLLRSAYLKSPADMWGKSPRGLSAGALYLAGLLEEEWERQDNVSQVVGVALATLSSRYTQLMVSLNIEKDSIPNYGTKHVKTRTKQAKSLIETRRQNREAARNVVTWADEVLEPGKTHSFGELIQILENKARSDGFPRVTGLPWRIVADTLVKSGIIKIRGHYAEGYGSDDVVHVLNRNLEPESVPQRHDK